jgi:acetyl-CoA C-acetyltransferase
VADAFIVEAVRTPVGKRGGGLAHVHPADLGAHSIRALIERAGVDPGAVDDVILGNVDSIGPQAGCIARTSWLIAGFPDHVPGTTIDRRCGSSQQAVHFAAQAVMSGAMDLVVAGGVQSMSQVPMMLAFTAGQPEGFDPFTSSPGWVQRYGTIDINQYDGAEEIARRWGITRDDADRFSAESNRRARTAQDEGRFAREIVPIDGVALDEGPRDPDLDRIRSLPTLLPGGVLTAASSSQISDASAALLIASERAVKAHGLKPRARIHHMTVLANDPVVMLSAPIPATRRALERTGMRVSDIDVVENNEAFAPIVLAWLREFDIDPDRVNPNGGAIALGHPLGATGARLMTTLLHELERTGGRFGLQTMCERGGMANVTIIERL